jgi:hypothetical protein
MVEKTAIGFGAVIAVTLGALAALGVAACGPSGEVGTTTAAGAGGDVAHGGAGGAMPLTGGAVGSAASSGCPAAGGCAPQGGSGGAPSGGAATGGGGASGGAGASGTGGLGSGGAGAAGTDAGPADDRSAKRGAAYNFCDWSFSEGEADLALLRTGTGAGSGITWYYNWGVRPAACVADALDDAPPVEFVPMAWGLTNGGVACATGGACFTDSRSRDQLRDQIPPGSRYLLGFNEPNFAHQSNLTPTVAAQAWAHLEYVADARGLGLVGPAINFCDTTPGSDHGGSCTEEPAERTFAFDDYSETFPAGYRYNAFEWAELFYDECSQAGAAGHDCRIDYQAGHVYSYWALSWFVDIFARKAGLMAPTAAHCTNGVEDADEFGVDCGGNACAACSAWARAQFAKALWLTEFAPSTDDAGGPQTNEQRIARTLAYIASELPILEASGAVFRYAWFMPKTDIGSLDHVDLLTETTPVTRTEVGLAYLNHPH